MYVFVNEHNLFREANSFPRVNQTVSYKEQIMSKTKCLSIFSPRMEATVFIILQFFSQCAQF